MAQPYIRFFGTDWRSDPGLRMCCAASRGVWADCITLMMEAEPYGHLVINGKAATPEQIAALTVTPLKVVRAALAELEANNVYSISEAGVIFSRRMLRDQQKAEEAREFGRLGGNPRLKSKDKAGINGHDNREPTLALTVGDKPHGNTIPNASPNAKENQSSIEAEFKAWYGAYPRKIAPGAALKAYQRARRDGATPQALTDGARRYAADPTRKPDFTKHPATWLNGQCWLDDAPSIDRGSNDAQSGESPFAKAVIAWHDGGRKGARPTLEEFYTPEQAAQIKAGPNGQHA